MTKEDPSRRNGRKWVLCPKCGASTWGIVLSLPDSKTGKIVRIYRCDCGEYIWDD